MLFEKLAKTVDNLKNRQIPAERQLVLHGLIEYIQSKVDAGQNTNLIFICTHNSRRSHLSQIWAQTAAYFYQLKNIYCYSGGTEVTALFPVVSETLINSGFQIATLSADKNPVYAIKYTENEPAIIGFSKTFDHKFNPQSDFAAIMTCSQADAGCPFIVGADKRFPVTYDDPKAFDNKPQQAAKYQERSNQIAAEMFYAFSQIKPLK
jgi:arsenate reductase